MNATDIELYWRWQHHTTLRVRMCYLTKSVIKGLEMGIRFLLPKKTNQTKRTHPNKQTNKNPPQFWKVVFTADSVHPWQNVWFYEGWEWYSKNISPSHIDKEELVWELHCCIPWDDLPMQKDLSGAVTSEFSLAPSRTISPELWQIIVIEKRQPLNVWTNDLLYELFNQKVNISYFGVLYTYCTHPSLTSAATRGG